MSKRIDNYFNKKENIAINKIKEELSDKIIKQIRDYDLDYEELASRIGMTPDRYTNILIQPKNNKGSELLLMSDNINIKKKVINNKK